jgi:hypothetical protein
VSEPHAELAAAVESALGRRAVRWRRPHTGLSAADRFVVTFDDGSSVFVKAAVDARTAEWLRVDHEVMTSVGDDFVLDVISWVTASGHPVLIMEDAHDAYWPADHERANGEPVAWCEGQVEALLDTLDRVGASTSPPLPPLGDGITRHWSTIAADPSPYLGLGLFDERWLSSTADALVRAEAAVDFSGDALVHNDVRSDNVCFRGHRTILVDWSHARRGNPVHDRAALAVTLPLEGGPEPFALLPEEGKFAAWHAGQALHRMVGESEGAPPWLIAVLGRMAGVALRWASLSLGVAPPTTR